MQRSVNLRLLPIRAGASEQGFSAAVPHLQGCSTYHGACGSIRVPSASAQDDLELRAQAKTHGWLITSIESLPDSLSAPDSHASHVAVRSAPTTRCRQADWHGKQVPAAGPDLLAAAPVADSSRFRVWLGQLAKIISGTTTRMCGAQTW